MKLSEKTIFEIEVTLREKRNRLNNRIEKYKTLIENATVNADKDLIQFWKSGIEEDTETVEAIDRAAKEIEGLEQAQDKAKEQPDDWEDYIKREAEYALRSRSMHLLYEAYGMQLMAYAAGAIGKDAYYRLNDLIVTHGMNNPQWCRENYGGEPK